MSRFSTFVCLFMLYGFIGWACEMVYCAIALRRVTNRGFLNGPICPIYAVGAFCTIGLATLVPHRLAVIFLLGLTADTLVEYLTGTLLELIFHTKYWDYSDNRFNFRGRICLKNSLLFGVMSAGLVFFIHPAFVRVVSGVPSLFREWAAVILLVLFGADMTVSILTALRLNSRLRSIYESMQAVKEKLDNFGFETTASIRERLDKLAENRGSETTAPIARAVDAILERVHSLERSNQLQRRLLRAFPKIRSTRYPEYLAGIIAQFDSRRRHS